MCLYQMVMGRQTGPLVYPAGFVYIYSALYKLTNNGQNILLAQYLFMALYIVFIATVFFVYARSKVVKVTAFQNNAIDTTLGSYSRLCFQKNSLHICASFV